MSTTTTEPCSTGVINELGGCEPVGVTPLDLQEPETIVEVGTVVYVPPTLPQTGAAEGVFAAIGSLALFAGLGLVYISRKVTT